VDISQGFLAPDGEPEYRAARRRLRLLIGEVMAVFLLYDGAAGAGAVPGVRQQIAGIVSGAALQPGLADDLSLAATELITNAAEAGACSLQVLLSMPPPGVRLDVTDDAPGEPRLPPVDSQAISGRGLQIVAALADQWGCRPAAQDGHKTVWATFDPEPHRTSGL
jgi:hypothetical protein